MENAAVVFVHGLFSSSRTWSQIRNLINSDPEFTTLTLLDFDYPSPKFEFSPLRRIPNYTVVADSLKTYLETAAAKYPNIAIVTHSQGGLIAQRYLARMVTSSQGYELQRIRRVLMFACPNSGSDAFILARRWAKFWRHPHERELRPINESVSEAQQVVINRIVYAKHASSDQCPIEIFAYAGDQDNIVTPASARGVFTNVGVLPGDHNTIIQPDSREHRTYIALKMQLLKAFGDANNILGELPLPLAVDLRNRLTPARKGIPETPDQASSANQLADTEINSADEYRPLLGRMRHPRLGTLDFYDRQTMAEVIREVGKLDE